MCRRRNAWLTFATFFVLLGSVSTAHGQAWLSDRKRAEGAGIRLGDFELHPGVGVEGGYHSNPFFSDRPKATGILRISPHLFLSTLNEERQSVGDTQQAQPGWLSFNGGLAGSFLHYFQYAVRDAVNVDLNGKLTLAPARPVSFVVSQVLRRSALPFSDTTLPPEARSTQRAADYTNYQEKAGAQLLFQTAGGLLQGGLGYNFAYIWFDGGGFKFNNNYTHTATFNLGWEFLPKTALFYDLTFRRQKFTKLGDETLASMAINRLVNNDGLTSRIGLNGAITSRIGATVSAGYTAGFYKTGNDFEGVVGTIEARYTPTNLSELALTFDRGFLPSYQGNYQDRTSISARARWLFGGAFLLSAQAGVEFLAFGYDAVQMSTRDDRRYLGQLSGEYRFIDWLAVTAQAGFLIDDTDFVFRINGAEDPAKFSAYEAWLGLRAFL